MVSLCFSAGSFEFFSDRAIASHVASLNENTKGKPDVCINSFARFANASGLISGFSFRIWTNSAMSGDVSTLSASIVTCWPQTLMDNMMLRLDSRNMFNAFIFIFVQRECAAGLDSGPGRRPHSARYGTAV